MLPGCSRENPFPSIQIWILCYSSFLAVTQAQHTDLYLPKKKKKSRKRLQGKHTQSHTLWCCVTSDHAGRGVIRSGRWAVKCLPPFFLPWLNGASNQGSEHLHRRPLMLKCDLISRFEAHLAADVNDSRLAGAFGVIPAFHLGWKWAGWWVWRRKHRPSPLAPIYKITYKSTQSVPSVTSSSTALSYRNNRKSTKTEPGSCLFSTWSRLSVCWL